MIMQKILPIPCDQRYNEKDMKKSQIVYVVWNCFSGAFMCSKLKGKQVVEDVNGKNMIFKPFDADCLFSNKWEDMQ